MHRGLSSSKTLRKHTFLKASLCDLLLNLELYGCLPCYFDRGPAKCFFQIT